MTTFIYSDGSISVDPQIPQTWEEGEEMLISPSTTLLSQTMTQSPSPSEQLAARLLYLQQQKKAIETEEREVKTALEELYASDAIPAKDDISMLFSDGTFHKVRLQRQKTGTYFKVGDDHKDAYSKESHSLQARYLKAGKAEMAEKSPTWRVQEVK